MRGEAERQAGGKPDRSKIDLLDRFLQFERARRSFFDAGQHRIEGVAPGIAPKDVGLVAIEYLSYGFENVVGKARAARRR